MDIIVENNIIKTKELFFDENVGGVGTVFHDYMKRHGNNIAQTEADTGKSDTYASLLQKCVRAAIALKDKGIKKGDLVTLCASNHLHGCVPIIAALFLGAIPTALEPTAVAHCSYLLNKIRPKIIFLEERSEELIRSCFKTLNWQTETVTFERDFEIEFLSPKPNEESFEPLYIEDLQETAFIYFTSGSSGLPKPVCLNHYCFLASSSQIISKKPSLFSSVRKQNNSVNTIMSFSGWFWVSSGIVLKASILEGQQRVLVNEFDPIQLCYYIEKYKITYLHLPPFLAIEWYESARPKNVDLSSLKIIMIGGASLPNEHYVKMKTKFPEVMIIQVYGQTEVGGAVTDIFNARGIELLKTKPTTLGLPVTGVRYKIVDPETEKSLGFNQPGELRVKSRRVMNGYYNDEIETRKAFDEDGFFKTGDMLYYDEDFCFYFVQRLKETFKYRGWMLSPVVIEDVLLQHPAVKNAVVIGKPDEVEGNHPMGVVILKADCDATEEELVKFVGDRVEDKMRLRGGVKFVDSYPLGPTGKVNRIDLTEIVLKC